MNRMTAVIGKYFSPQEASGQRINNFNIIRIVAAAMVIYGHMSSVMGVYKHTIYDQAVSTLAVKILFVISGYLIMVSLRNDAHFGRYMVRRCFRIFPGLIGVVLFAVLIVGPISTSLPLTEYFTSRTTWTYLRNILLYPIYVLPGVFSDYTYPNAVNGSLWTLPIEFALYLILPALLWIFKKLGITRGGGVFVTLLCIAADCVYTGFFPTARFVFYGSNWPDALAIVPYFFMGSLFALPEMKKLLNLQIATLFMVLLAIFKVSSVKYELVLCFILPYFVLSVAMTERPVFSRWFAKCDFSYGLYLYGFVMQQVIFHQLQKIGGVAASLNLVFLICFAATFVCAVISWYLIEKPMQNVGKKILKHMQA